MNISRVEINCPVFGLFQGVKVAVCFINLESREEALVGNITWEYQSIHSTETHENG